MVRVELYINNVLIPLSEELSIPLNFQISDVQKPEARQGNYSKSVVVPSSKETDQLFGHIYDLNMSVDSSGTINFSPDFNPNLKADAIVLNDGVEVFNGIAQLVDVKVRDRLDISYSLVLTSKLRSLFDEIGDSELRDLDFSEYDHEYTLTNVENSWATSIIKNGSSYPFTIGEGYVYPLIDYGFSTDLQNFNLINLYPALSVREYMVKIFENAGYTWDSTFLDSTFFKRLYVPFSSPYLNLNSTQILDRRFRAERTSTQTINVTLGYSVASEQTIVFSDDSTGSNFDTSDQYDNVSGVFTVGTGLQGVFNFTGILRLGMVLTPTTAGVSYRQVPDLKVYVKIVKNNGLASETVLNSYTQSIRHLDYFTTSYTTANPATLPDDDFTALNNPANYIAVNATNVSLEETDTVQIIVTPYLFYSGWLGGSYSISTPFVTSTGTTDTGSIQLQLYSGSVFYNNVDNAQIIEGQTVYANNLIPDKVKQKDFLVSIIRMFNLYFEQDTENTNKFKIEPRSDYYTTTVTDWTQKIDLSNDLVSIPMGALDVKKFQFKHKEDSDYFNAKYKDRWKETYGERNIEVINDFVKGTKTIETIFSATPSVGNEYSDRVIPRIVKIDDYGVVSQHEGNIRILYYAGLKTTNQVWNINYSGGSVAYSSYPYIGMTDDAFTPTVDINWGVPAEIFWQPVFDDITYTNNNLFNKYWKDFITEIIHPSSRIVRAKFKLNPMDIFTLNFRNLFYFENEFFRLNRVIDYNPITSDVTECEFIKVVSGVSFTAESTNIDGANDNMGDSSVYTGLLTQRSYEVKPLIGTARSKDGGTVRRMDTLGMDYGTGNRIGYGVRSYFVTGNYNSIGDGSNNVTILDSSGVTVAGGLTNVYISGSNNLEVVDSNVTVVNNTYVSGANSTRSTSQNSTMSDRCNTYFIDTTGGARTFRLLTALGRQGKDVTIKNIGTNTLRVIANSGETIDGSSFVDIVTQYDSITIKSDNDNWYII